MAKTSNPAEAAQQVADAKFLAFAVELERHRQQLEIHGADADQLQQRYAAYLAAENKRWEQRQAK